MSSPPRASRELKSQWLQVVEHLMVLGIERPTHMAKKTGLTFHTAKRWRQEIKDRWTSTLTEEAQNFRREFLYQEAESLAVVETKIHTDSGTQVAVGLTSLIIRG